MKSTLVMKITSAKRPFTVYILIFLLAILGLNGLAGGIGLIGDSSGEAIGFPLAWLENTPFNDYLIPGHILFTVLGIFPIVVSVLLYFKPEWSAMRPLERFTHEHWSWLASLTVGVAAVIWIVVQFLMLGVRHPVQIGLEIVVITLGIVIIAVSLFPSVRHYYQIPKTL
jgi:hypothetical protein